MKYGKHFNSKWASKILYNTYEIDIITIGHRSKKRVTAVTRNRQKKLAQNAKSLKFALPCRTNDIYIVYFSQKCPSDIILMIYALLSRKFVAAFFALFSQNFGLKSGSRKVFRFWGVCYRHFFGISVDFLIKPNKTQPSQYI